MLNLQNLRRSSMLNFSEMPKDQKYVGRVICALKRSVVPSDNPVS
jgi:hypothetical protein